MDRFSASALLLCLLLAPLSAVADSFGSICRTELLTLIYAKSPVHVVDVQKPSEFAAHNYEGSVAASDPAALRALAADLLRDSAPVVIVGEKDGEPERCAAATLAAAGVASSRLRILEGGMEGALAASGACDCCNAGGKPK